MKKIAFCLLALAFVFGSSSAQDGRHKGSGMMDNQREEIQNLKIAFMTKELSLTPAESEKYWPVYNQYWAERVKLAHQKRQLFKKIEAGTATQSDIDALVTLTRNESTLMAKYSGEIARITSVDKAAKTFVAEEKFKGTLLRTTSGSRGHGSGMGGR